MSDEFIETKDIDLRNIFNKVLRNKFIILIITIAGFSFGLFSSLKKPTLWKGEFQIIISKGKENQSFNLGFAGLTGLGFGNSSNSGSLNTEIEILKSPSVLLPVFNYVKDFKIKNKEVSDNWKYSSWVDKYLKVELIQGTTILNIKYLDSNKEIILPVLTKISKAYQLYSGRDRLKGLDNTIKYLNDQIKQLKIKSNESIKLATAFAKENDLSIGTYESSLGNDVNIENARVSATNNLRETEILIDSLKGINNKETDTIVEFANIFGNFSDDPLLVQLGNIDYSISSYKINYISEPVELKILKKQKMLLGQNLKNKLEKYLNAKKLKYESIISSSTRGKGVIEKYRELTSEAFRNNKLLAKLEDDKQLINLERSKNEEPWELIFQPSLLDNPVDKEIFKELILFTSLSFLTSIFLVLLLENKRGVLYETSEIENLIGIPIIANLSNIDTKEWNEITNLIANKIKKGSKDDGLSIITIGQLDKYLLNLFLEKLSTYFKKENFIFSEDISKVGFDKDQIIVTGLSKVNRKELIELKSKLILQNSNNLGFVIIEDGK